MLEPEYTNLKHAEHNHKFCASLIDKEEFSDWAITVSFYSAYHYVLHSIFPLELTNHKGEKIVAKDFDDYCTIKNIKGKKHKEVRKLVDDNLPKSISVLYNHLLDMSWTARYHQYSFGHKYAKTAFERLCAIKDNCKSKSSLTQLL